MKLTFRQKRKPVLPLMAAIFLLLFAPAAYLLSRFPHQTEAAWFDDSWKFRQAIAIPSHTTTENNVYVTVPAFDATDASKFQADCGDLRFTKQNGELLPYFVVDCDATADVHVQFDTLPAGASTYYMYYGNPAAVNGTEAADFTTAASGLGVQSAAAEEKGAAPVAYWKFNEGYGNTTADVSPNGNTGTLGGTTAPTWQTEGQCLSGKCLYFDGITSKVTGSAIIKNVQTISFWIKPNTIATQGLVDLDGGTHKLNTNSSGVLSAVGFTSPVYYLNGQATTTPTLVLNQWNFVSVTTAAGFDSTGSWTVGTDGTNFQKGFFDDLKIYSYARSAAQIKADFKARGTTKGSSVSLGASSKNLDALSNGLVGYWKTDEATWSGTLNEVVDASGNGNHGTAAGTTGGMAYPTSGKFGNGGLFDGVDDYVSLATAASLNITSNITMTAWVKTSSATGSVIIGGYNAGADNTGYGLGYGQTVAGKISYWSQSYGSWVTANSTVNDGSWHHIAVSVSGTVATFYKDGQIDGTATTNVPSSYSGTRAIGARKDGLTPFTGSLDDVRIYNRALSPAEVSQLYNWAPAPVGEWNFEEGSGNSVNDSSGNGHLGTWSGTGSHWSSGKFGKSGKFNGSDDYVSAADASPLDLSGNLTITAWINPSSLPTETSILSKGGAGGSCHNYDFYIYNGKLALLSTAACNWAKASATASVSTAVWQFVAVTFDGANANYYIDGKYYDSVSWGIGSTNNNSLDIGRQQAGAAGYFTGQIDQVRIYNYARSQKQIIEDMNAGHPAGGSPVGSQIGYWKFDEGYGATANNSGNGGSTLNGTITGAAWSNNGKFGKALQFSAGSNQYVAKTDDDALDLRTGSMTLSAWIKTSTTGVVQTIIRKDNGSGLSGYIFRIESDNRLRISFSDADSSATSNATAGLVTDGQWHHVAAKYDRDLDMQYLYVDGKQVDSDDPNISGDVNNTNGIRIGDWAAESTPLVGLIDEVKIYNSALTDDEIRLDMNRGSAQILGALGDNSSYAPAASNQQYCVPGDTTSCAAPVGEWNFETGSGQTAYDTSGNGGNGIFGASSAVASDDPTWSRGKFGKGLLFDGSDDYLDIPDTSYTDYDYNQEFSVMAWIRAAATQVDASNIDNDVIEKWSLSGGYPYVIRYYNQTSGGSNGKVFACRYDGAANPCITSNATINDGAFHHVAFAKSGSSLYLYVDGAQQNSTPDTTTTTTTNGSPLCIGQRCNNTNRFTGSVDGLRIYNYGRTPAQIAWDYNQGRPVGWWKFDECQGSTMNDSSGNQNSGTWNGAGGGSQTAVGTCAASAATAWYNGATGKFNSSLNYDGTDDYVTIGDVALTKSAGQLSVSAWVNTNTLSGGENNIRNIVAKEGTASTATEHILRLDTDGDDFEFYVGGSAYVGTSSGSSITISTGAWYHLVGTFDATGNSVKLYVNGALVDSTPKNTATGTTTQALRIGNNDRGLGEERHWSGQIDDVRVYNYALTATQVKQIYNQGGGIRFGPATGSP